MKKILLLLSIPLFAFQCETDEPTPHPFDCNCFNEVVYINDGIDTVLIERTEAPAYRCELWGQGDNYLKLNNSDFWHRYKCE
jgi:hypothetical protein